MMRLEWPTGKFCREVALVFVLPRPEEGIACSIFPEGALFRKAYFAEGSDINVQPS